MTVFPLGDVEPCESGGALVDNGTAVRWFADRRRAIKAAGGPDLDHPRPVEVLAVSPHLNTREKAAAA